MALPSLVAPEYETIIPSTKQTIKYRPFLVKEEKILYLAMESGEEKEILHALMNLLKSWILDEVDTNVLTTYDLEYLFLNIRAKSVNDVINLNVKHQDQETCDGVTKIEITISENSTKDYILIDDAINLIIKILKKGRQSIYNVASGKNIKIKEITKIIKKETNCKIILKNQKTVILEPKIDIMRIKKEFKFKNNFKLEKSLPELIKRYKKNI